MMNYLKLLIVFIFSYSLTSCSKEDDNTTNGCIRQQQPGMYFPAYPKSWWHYYNYNNELVKFEISKDYQECGGYCRPVFTTINKCIQGNSLIYHFYVGIRQPAKVESPIYSTTKDSILFCPISFSTFKEGITYSSQGYDKGIYRRKSTILDTNLTINGANYSNILVVYEYSQEDSLHRYYDYFSKNIGLVKRDSVNISDTTDLIEILRIKSYNIGR